MLGCEDGPLVWVSARGWDPHRLGLPWLMQIDCEMTGLDPMSDVLLEIAVIVTDGRLNAVDEGIEYVIHVEKEVLDKYKTRHSPAEAV